MVLLVRGRGAENIKKKKKTNRRKTLKNKEKKKKNTKKPNNYNEHFNFTFYIKKSFFAQK